MVQKWPAYKWFFYLQLTMVLFQGCWATGATRSCYLWEIILVMDEKTHKKEPILRHFSWRPISLVWQVPQSCWIMSNSCVETTRRNFIGRIRGQNPKQLLQMTKHPGTWELGAGCEHIIRVMSTYMHLPRCWLSWLHAHVSHACNSVLHDNKSPHLSRLISITYYSNRLAVRICKSVWQPLRITSQWYLGSAVRIAAGAERIAGSDIIRTH